MNCLCPYCESVARCGGRAALRESCPDYEERQSAPRAYPEGALPSPASAYTGEEKVIGDTPIIAQETGGAQ